MQKVEFIVAGVQKGGTTALFDYLSEHPSLELPPKKELHFFDDENVNWGQPDVASYERNFALSGRIWGEVTPIYIYWPQALERIAHYNPEMRLILLFRDPIERAWSHWKMEYAKGKERQPFAWCIREGRERLASPANERPGYHRVYSYVERGFYGSQLENALRLFDRSQLLLLRSEDLDRNPAAVLSRISEFLGITDFGQVRPRRLYEARVIDYPSTLTPEDRSFLANTYAPELDLFQQLSDIDLADWAHSSS